MVVLATIGTFVLAALSWLGLTPNQPGPTAPVRVLVLQFQSEIVATPALGIATLKDVHATDPNRP
jgi:hypothetical protein